MADMWVGVNGADEALRQVNAEMLGGARALADQAAAQVVAIVWGASAAGHAKALASWGADRVVIVESGAAPAPEAVARTLARLAAESAPAVVLLADGAESRVAAPLLAEALDAPLFSDVVDIEAGDEVFFTRLKLEFLPFFRTRSKALRTSDKDLRLSSFILITVHHQRFIQADITSRIT